MDLIVHEILEATHGKLIHGKADVRIGRVSTDSRKIEPGSLFIPLKGPAFDGHDFIDQACQAGAVGYLKEKSSRAGSKGICIEVDDPLTALQELAAYVRKSFKGPVIAVTGSNGKTTTREMLYAILALKHSVLKSEGNLNNHIGVPLTLLKMTAKHQMILLEMGINHPGELRRLCEIGRPTMGLITNIGEAHLEGLGSPEGVAQAKGELLDFLLEGVAVINTDTPFYSQLKERQKGRRVSFGLAEEADFRGVHIQPDRQGTIFTLKHEKDESVIHLAVPGTHNVYNAMGAAAAASMLGCASSDIIQGLNSFQPVPLRSEIVDLHNQIKVLLDAYNANPSSMEAAVRMLVDLGKEENRRTVAVLGDMLELGRSSEDAHFKLGKTLGRLKIGRLYLYGPEACQVFKGAVENGMPEESIKVCSTHEKIAEEIRKLSADRSLLLIKGSRGMKMEKVLDLLKKE
ncbi:MAG: UDP-N-acetylmuramoyl-tripeptide--D-alanyl-D-alanine ligase [Nitrospirae bacterium]|nr:UDP-N-acetylmuramoyl-tripeptide--D-alanyl-D-alanine ligase [Nitrospirota bacterium]